MQNATQNAANVAEKRPGEKPGVQAAGRLRQYWPVAALIAVTALLVPLFWDAILVLIQRWSSDPDYHHGFLVPPFAAYLLWRRRDRLGDLSKVAVTPAALAVGVLFLALAGVIRAASVMYYIRILDPAAMIPAFMGIVVCLFGWRGLRWAWPAGVFLFFMLPMPGAAANLLSHPLQRVGTIASTFIIQTMGIPAIAEGNVITLREGQLEVVRACSGLKMMSLFFAVCWGAAFLSERPWLDRVLMILSAPPVALVANILRITLTAVLMELGVTSANLDHELAGWLMMPTAVLILYAELAIWDRILVPVEEAGSPRISAPAQPQTHPV